MSHTPYDAEVRRGVKAAFAEGNVGHGLARAVQGHGEALSGIDDGGDLVALAAHRRQRRGCEDQHGGSDHVVCAHRAVKADGSARRVVFRDGHGGEGQIFAGDYALMRELGFGVDGPIVAQVRFPVVGEVARVGFNGHAAADHRVVFNARYVQLVHLEAHRGRAVGIQIPVQQHAVVRIAAGVEDGFHGHRMPLAVAVLNLGLLAHHPVKIGGDDGVVLLVALVVVKGQGLGQRGGVRVQNGEPEVDFVRLGHRVHHHGELAAHGDIAVRTQAVPQFRRPFQRGVGILIPILLVVDLSGQIRLRHIHVRGQRMMSPVFIHIPEGTVARRAGEDQRSQDVIVVHRQIQAVIRVGRIEPDKVVFGRAGFQSHKGAVAACGVDLGNDDGEGVLLNIDSGVVVKGVFPVGRGVAHSAPPGLAFHGHGADIDLHPAEGHAVIHNIIPDVHGRGQFLVDAELQPDLVVVLFSLGRLNEEVGLALKIDFAHGIKRARGIFMQRHHAGDLFHQHIVGFRAVLIKEKRLYVDVYQLRGRFAGDAVHAAFVFQLEVCPLRHRVHPHVNLAGGDDAAVRILPLHADLEIFAHTVRCNEHEELLAGGQFPPRGINSKYKLIALKLTSDSFTVLIQ